MTFKGLNDVSQNLNRKEYFKMFNGNKLTAKVPLSGKKIYNYAVIIPQELRNCNKFAKDILCYGCEKLLNQNKKISANLNELKRQAPNEFGHMLLKNITN